MVLKSLDARLRSTADSKGKEDGDEARHDRARPHGWKHGPAARAGRPRGGHVHAVGRRHSLHDRGARLGARATPRRLDDGSGGRRDGGDLHHAPRLARTGRRHRRRRQLELPRLEAPRRRGPREGDSLRRRRRVGRDLGPRGRLLPDGGRGRRNRRDRRAGFPHARARGRLRALRPGRRRPLREDGAQRDRVRADAGLRRGVRDRARSPSTTSTCTKSPESGATARSCARGCSTCCIRPSSSTAQGSTTLRASSRTRARGGGRSRRRSTKTFRSR